MESIGTTLILTLIILNTFEVFSLLSLVRPAGRILLSPERSKVCFELLEMNSAAQNPCSCRGLETPSEVGSLIIFKIN